MSNKHKTDKNTAHKHVQNITRNVPNVMVALPNVGGALYSTPQSLADAHYYMLCSNAAKTRKQLKFGGVPQTNETISAASGPKFIVLCGRL